MKLAARAYASGQRLLIVGAADALEALDRALWVDEPASFLPHAIAGRADDADQPILLSEVPEARNGAALLMLLESGIPPEFERFGRVLNLFDDSTPAHARARTDWRALGSRDGLVRTYWQQTERGGWEKKD